MNKKKTRKGRKPKCKTCKVTFERLHKDKVTCSAACKKTLQRKTQHQQLRKKLLQSKFYIQFTAECRRAGTSKVINTIEDFDHLYNARKLINSAATFSTYWDCDDNGRNCSLRLRSTYHVELCHLYPVAGKDGKAGTLNRCNLTVAPKALNRFYGNDLIYKGLLVKNEHYVIPNEYPNYKVSTGTTDKEILCMLERIVGKTKLYEWVKLSKLPQRVRQTPKDEFTRHGMEPLKVFMKVVKLNNDYDLLFRLANTDYESWWDDDDEPDIYTIVAEKIKVYYQHKLTGEPLPSVIELPDSSGFYPSDFADGTGVAVAANTLLIDSPVCLATIGLRP